MKDSVITVRHYHDLALEFLIMTRLAAAPHVRERYRIMGEHYLARAGAELARVEKDRSRGEPMRTEERAKAA